MPHATNAHISQSLRQAASTRFGKRLQSRPGLEKRALGPKRGQRLVAQPGPDRRYFGKAARCQSHGPHSLEVDAERQRGRDADQRQSVDMGKAEFDAAGLEPGLSARRAHERAAANGWPRDAFQKNPERAVGGKAMAALTQVGDRPRSIVIVRGQARHGTLEPCKRLRALF